MELRQDLAITVGERHFLIGKFTPQTGCYWAYRVLGSGVSGLDEALKTLTSMDQAEFFKLQNDCLSVIKVDINGKWFNLRDETGGLAVPVEGPDLLDLTLNSFANSLAPFFDKARLTKMAGALVPLLQNLGIVTSSTSQSEGDTGNSVNSGTEPTL